MGTENTHNEKVDNSYIYFWHLKVYTYLPGGDSAVIKKTAGLGLSRPSHSGAVRFQRLERVITA